MKVNAFITLYNARVKGIKDLNSDVIIQTIKDLIHPIQYVSFDNKIKMIKQVILETKDLEYPTAERHRSFLVHLVSLYTDLEVTIEDFDILSQTKMIDVILPLFESDYRVCNSLLLMCLDDMKGR